MVEGAPLERVYAGNRIESSNLSLSAMSITKIGLILEDLVVSVAFPFNIEFDRLLLSQEFKTTKESTMKKKIQGVFFLFVDEFIRCWLLNGRIYGDNHYQR